MVRVEALSEGAGRRWVGERVGGHRLLRLIDEGAMAQVFEASDETRGATVAVKILRGGGNADPVASRRLVRELETARSLSHRHIVDVYEGGRTPGGSWFITMEHLEGETLKHALAEGEGLQPARLISVVSQLALALEHAHGRGVVHRDLKPANVFLCRAEGRDEVKVLDWGSVKRRDERGEILTAAGTTLGSPSYMSAEQASGEEILDGRSDVFSLAVLAFEMATGTVPFTGRGVAEILSRVVNAEAPAPSALEPGLPGGLDDALTRGLAKEPGARTSGALALAQDIARAFGLSEDVEGWAHSEVGAIEEALARARPMTRLRTRARTSKIVAALILAATLALMVARFALSS